MHSQLQAHEENLKEMEARMLEAQDGIIKRTVTLMENKAAAFNRAVQVRKHHDSCVHHCKSNPDLPPKSYSFPHW